MTGPDRGIHRSRNCILFGNKARNGRVSCLAAPSGAVWPTGRCDMAKKGFEDRGQGLGRREVLECMVWAGTGELWAVSGDVPQSGGYIVDAISDEVNVIPL